MFRYYLKLALANLRRNVLTAVLMILAIGVGIGASTTMLTIFRAASGDPIPQKSGRLFVPQIDNFGPAYAWRGDPDSVPPLLTYLDASAWMQAHVGARQAALYPVLLSISPPNPARNAIRVYGHATYGDFFSMFNVPFTFGGAWSRKEDERHTAVVVLSSAFNDQLFGGANSVGQLLSMGGKLYRIIGVMARWHPTPRFYDPGFQSYSSEDQIFMPFTRAIDEQIPSSGAINCDAAGAGKGWNDLLHSNCIWMRYWVELPSIGEVERYRSWLQNYAAEQRRNGRQPWPPHIGLRNVGEWLKYSRVVPPAVDALTAVAFSLLFVCLLNAAGLMLANVMGRCGPVGIRRALGATRLQVFAQFMVETGLIGLAGGAVGLGVTEAGLLGCRILLDRDLSVLARLHASDVLLGILLALVATLISGVYPTWRAMQVAPALQLKTL